MIRPMQIRTAFILNQVENFAIEKLLVYKKWEMALKIFSAESENALCVYIRKRGLLLTHLLFLTNKTDEGRQQ